MALNKKLISFATQAQFDVKLNAGDIDNRSIVFIEDKKRIWTHGVYFDTSWDYISGAPDTLDGYGITDAAKKINSLYYVEGNTTGTAGSWTGSIPEVTSLYAGLTIAYKIGVAGASTTNLNINSLGNKLVRRNASNLTTHLPVGSVAILTYDGTYWVWADYDTNSNTYDRTYWNNTITAGAPIYRYKLLMQGLDGKFYPLTLETGTGTTKTVSTQEFEINSQILYYNTTATVAANSTAKNVYSEIPITTLSYTANQASWTSQQLIYLKGTILPNGNFKLDNTSYTSFMTQTLPTTADGFVYVLLGYMYSTTAMRLFQFHPMYEYRDGALRTYIPMHSHGNITDGGAIGSVANKPIITGTGGVLQVGSFGTLADTFAEGNHTHGQYLESITKAQVEAVLTGNITSHTHSYLPLVGGTLIGSSYNMLELKRSSANGSSVLFSNSSVNLGKIGFTANGNLIIGTGASTDGVANMLSITPSGVAQFYGNISTSGLVTGTGFSKTGATDAHVLLGSGGHKSISDFNASLVTSTTTSGISNVATSNTNTYLNIVQGGASIGSSTRITGSGSVTVSSDVNGVLTINGVDTTYTTGTLAQLNAGTDTTGMLQTAKLLNDWLNPKLDLKATPADISTAVDGIEIGGRNLLPHSDFSKGVLSVLRMSDGGNLSVENGMLIATNNTSHGSQRLEFKMRLDKGVYTLAYKGLFTDNANWSSFQNLTVQKEKVSYVENTHTLSYLTFEVVSSEEDTVACVRTPYVQTPSQIEVDWMSLVRGNKPPQDWTPAPEDQVSDWNETDVNSFAFLKNKPTQLSQFTDNLGITSHITNKSNPHSVTKAQVGLGNVLNVASYSKTESDGKYLQLVGGTMSGSINYTNASGTNPMLVMNRASGGGAALARLNITGYDKGLGLSNSGDLIFGDWSGVSTLSTSWNKVWHKGNFANGTTAQYIRGDGSLATYANTTYSAMSVAEGTAGTATSSRTVRADYLKQIIQHYTGAYSSRANGSGASSNSIEAKDTRSINPLPNTGLQRGVWFDFKTNSTIGLTGASTYSSVITMVPYGDNSGNSNTAFRLAQSGNNLYFQNWTTVWGTWNKLWHSGNFATGTTAQYIRGDGSLATYSNYSAGTKELLLTGTNTSNRVWSSKTLKDWYLEEIDLLLDSGRLIGSTFSSNVIDLTNVNGAFNVNSVNNYTTYTLSNKKVRGAWARVLVNASMPITITGVKLINLGSDFELNTDMYLNIMYDGINTLGYYTRVIGKVMPSCYISTSSAIVAFTNTPINNFYTNSSSISIDGVTVSKSVIKEIWFSNEYFSVTSINNQFLYQLSSLTSLDLSGMINLTSIGDYFLYSSTSLTSLDLSELINVTAIGDRFLYSSTSLISLDLSSMTKLTSIGSYFLVGTKVKTLKMGALVPPTLGIQAFPSSLTSILVPSAAVSTYKSRSQWNSKASIITGY